MPASALTHMRIRDAMSAPAVTAFPTVTVRELAKLMLDNGIGSVVIVSPEAPDVPLGIVTETDLEVEEERSRSPSSTGRTPSGGSCGPPRRCRRCSKTRRRERQMPS